MRRDDAAVPRWCAVGGRGAGGRASPRGLLVVRQAVPVRGAPAALRPRRGLRADAGRAEGEARGTAHAAQLMGLGDLAKLPPLGIWDGVNARAVEGKSVSF